MPTPSSIPQPAPSPTPRRAYVAPELVRVHVDPIRELLQGTQCNPTPGSCVEPTCS
jgi:hypothetical protein